MDASVTVNSNQEIDIASLCWPIVESSPMPMAALEGSGHVVRYVNPAFCLLIGKTGEQLIGYPFSEAVPVGDECVSVLDRLSCGCRWLTFLMTRAPAQRAVANPVSQP